MALGLKFLALFGKLLDLETVHEKSHFEIVARKHIYDTPDADAVAYSLSVTAARFCLNTALAGGIVCVPWRCSDSRVAKFSGQTS